APDRLTDQLLIMERPVNLGGVEEGDAEVDRAVDGRDRFLVGRLAVFDIAVANHRHAADAERGDLQAIAEHPVFHAPLSSNVSSSVPASSVKPARLAMTLVAATSMLTLPSVRIKSGSVSTATSRANAAIGTPMA